jgi:hypothetical protein
MVPYADRANTDALIEAAITVLPRMKKRARSRDRLVGAVKEAIALHEASNPLERDTVEAWLLSGVDIADAARRTDLDQTVVLIYRDLFFDVLPWLAGDLNDLSWAVLGESMYHRQIAEDDVSTMKRFVALLGGPHVLERYLDYLKALPLSLPPKVSALSTEELERLKDLLFMRIYVLSHVPLKTPAQFMRMEIVLERSKTMYCRG